MNKSVGVSFENWPSQDVEELLSNGCLMHCTDVSEIIVARADCGHFTLGVGSADSTLIWHIETFEELLSGFAWVNFQSMNYLSREEFKEVGELTFVDIRQGIAHIQKGLQVPEIVAALIADMALQRVSDTLDRVLDDLEDEEEEEVGEL